MYLRFLAPTILTMGWTLVPVEQHDKRQRREYETNFAVWKRALLGDANTRAIARNAKQAKQLVETFNINEYSAIQLWQKEPGLLTLDHQEMEARLEELGKLVPGDPKVLAQLAPGLLTLTPDKLKHHLSAAAKLLGINQKQLQDLVWSHPDLIMLDSKVLEDRFKCLQGLLGSSAESAAEVAAADLSLLALRPEDLTTHFNKLMEITGLSKQEASAIVFSHPGLFDQDLSKVQDWLDSVLYELLLPPTATRQLVLRLPKLLLEDVRPDWCLKQIGRTFNVPLIRAVAIAREVPELLGMYESEIKQEVSALAKALKVSQEEALAMAADRPQLLAAVCRGLPVAMPVEAPSADSESAKDASVTSSS